jgi:Zn-dependent protease with chaperone function
LLLVPTTLPALGLTMGVVAGTSLAYTRYREAEADRSAFMNMPSLEKLEMAKAASE